MYDKLMQAITTVGFPIVVSGCLMYYIYKVECKTQEVLTKLNQSLVELKEVIESVKSKGSRRYSWWSCSSRKQRRFWPYG